jgi:hypothetical protein
MTKTLVNTETWQMKSKNGTPEKLCAIAQALEREIALYNQNARARKKRVAAALDELTKIVKKELRPFCNCQRITVITTAELDEFEAKMAIPCPVHGLSRLGILVTIGAYPNEHDPRDRRLDELVKQYQRSCIHLKKRGANEPRKTSL